MMIVTFPSSTEVPTGYSASPVPTSETDAIVVKSPEVDTSSVASIGGNTQGTLYIKFTKGNLTKAQIRIYGSYVANPGANDWYQESFENPDTTNIGTSNLYPFIIELTADTQISYHIPLGAYKAFKVTIKGVGTATGSSIVLNLGLRTN